MNEDEIKKYWQQLLTIMLEAKDEKTLNQLFDFLLTYDEREMLAKRLALTEALLRKDKPQRQISQDLKMSIALITRGSNELKRTDAKAKEFLKDLLNIKEKG